MKRTAKWHKHLTMKELKHLKEMGALSISGVVKARQNQVNQVNQVKQEQEHSLRTPRFTFNYCFECQEIEAKLFEAGVIKSIAVANPI